MQTLWILHCTILQVTYARALGALIMGTWCLLQVLAESATACKQQHASTFRIGSDDFKIVENWGLAPGGVRGTGSRVWPASVELALFLSAHKQEVYGKHVVELGAGCGGLPSMVSARAGAASVVASDGEPSTLPLLRQNIESNTGGSTCQVHVRKLRWGTEYIPAAEVILGADVVWGGGGGSSCSQRTLLDTLTHAVRVSPSTVIIISYCPRYKSEANFWEQVSTNFHITAFRRRSCEMKDAGHDPQRDGFDGDKRDQCGGVNNSSVSGGVDGSARGRDNADGTHLCTPNGQRDQEPRESATPAAVWSKCKKAEWARAGGICIFRLTQRVPASVVRGRASGGGSCDKNVLVAQRVDRVLIGPATACPGETEGTHFRNCPRRVVCSGNGNVEHVGGGSDGSDGSDGSVLRSQELLSDDSLLEAGGSGFDLDDLINPLDARE